MANPLERTLQGLRCMQKIAVRWDKGPLLVLAGPGAGKTRVLTRRIARLLLESPEQRFRVLGLTFTNKAAHEMKNRVAALVPDAVDRAEINTFHGFCAQILRQHGVHIGVRPDFEIYSRTADRKAVLADALRRAGRRFGDDDSQLLCGIDRLKDALIGPEQARPYLQDRGDMAPEAVERIGLAYRLYEEELRRANALDFRSLIRLTVELTGHSALAHHLRTMYRHWLVDEFQDTNGAQYELLRRMAGDNFRQLFAVADDDQIIYEWNGASVRRIRSLVDDFKCEVVQLTDNFRCPPSVVEAANRLVVYNVRRTTAKAAAESVAERSEGNEEIDYRVFPDDEDEVACTAAEIAGLEASEREETAVLARSRALLETVRAGLQALSVPAALLARRDDFASPQVRWLVAFLKQINRPLDRRNMSTLIGAFSRFSDVSPEPEEVAARSETNQITLLAAWLDVVRLAAPSTLPVVEAAACLTTGAVRLSDALNNVMACFSECADDDLKDDMAAWRRIENEIRRGQRTMPLDRFLQEMELRSKEPPSAPGAVSLSTIHGAKGLEFDRVYLIGLAEEVLPSWHSITGGNGGAAIEEERRSCFVAITRTRQRLVLSRAERYKGRPKTPSRFLREMGLTDNPVCDVPGRERLA